MLLDHIYNQKKHSDGAALMARLTPFWILLSSMLLVACGGGGGSVVPAASTDTTDTTDTTDGGSTETDTGVTYFPLQFYLNGDEYVEESGVFEGLYFLPLIHGYIIAPVDSTNLEKLDNPSVDDYSITINDQAIDPVEQGLVMQKIIDLPVVLNTAIVIDTSGSTQAIDKAALITAIKSFISTAQASSDSVIANQKYTLWAFGSSVEALVPTLTADASILNTALDSLQANWSGSRGDATALYESIVRAVGYYKGVGPVDLGTEVDLKTDGIDDLNDGYFNDGAYSRIDGVKLSNVVLFTAGNNSVNLFSAQSAKEALEWQSLITYVEQAATETTDSTTDTTATDTTAVDGSETTLVGKPLLYVSVGTGGVDASVEALASKVIDTASNNTFNVAAELIAAQQSAISVRIRPDNQYLVRYEILERDGKHVHVFSSESASYSYKLTTELDLATNDLSGLAEASPAVEITGPSNSYLAAGQVSVTSVKSLYPATRWTEIPYSTGNYSWTVGGVSRSANTDGSISITSADVGKTVVLTNTSLSITGTVTVLD